MDIYDQIIEELRSLVGKGKRFESDAALANSCEVDAAFVHKHLRGKVKATVFSELPVRQWSI